MLKGLEPENVFSYFEEICSIPHGSGNVGQISNYLVSFAQKRNLEYCQDETGNVVIWKEASKGYEGHPAVMLQGHMDMVAVKEAGCAIDMEKEGLKLKQEDGWLSAEGTSLGGDDGIAIAYGLALLDGEGYQHPPIELVVTVDEEVGMDGARALSAEPLKARRLINLDSEEEGIFLSGCAGGARVNMDFHFEKKEKKGLLCEVGISGLQGGHSGEEIHRERGNAICLLGRILGTLEKELELCLVKVEGGVADNAIPPSAKAEILVTAYDDGKEEATIVSDELFERECREKMTSACRRLQRELATELAEKDRGVQVTCSFTGMEVTEAVGEALSSRMIYLLYTLPYGVQAMSAAMHGLVETSLNPGLLSMGDEEMLIGISVRSSLESAKRALVGKLKALAELAGAETKVSGDYPGWAYQKESPLRDKMVEVYKGLYGKEPRIRAIHAGVECGLLIDKMPGLDCVSIGPDMKDIHTPKEALSIASVGRVWEYLLKVLDAL